MQIALVSPYEIGRQPFALAQPAAQLASQGFDVECIDLSIETFDLTRFIGKSVVAIHLAMHTGARLASEIIPQIAALKSAPVICVYGLYAPVNDAYFRSLGVQYVFGGESEADIVSLCMSLSASQNTDAYRKTRISMEKLAFIRPVRSGLPPLDQYSRLIMQDGSLKTVGFAEASRGCKHLCRHCPIVPVYSGKFRIVPHKVAMDDIRQQVDMGAEHISFGDPDFLNGPGHARRVIESLFEEFPQVSWDATIKIEHLLKHSQLVGEFAHKNCLFITSAVESVEDDVLYRLDKGHTAEDFRQALASLRGLGITMIPTFVPFTPWTTLKGYRHLLEQIVELQLVSSVPPVQLGIRLLLPQGSTLLSLPDRNDWLGNFDSEMLGYSWKHPDSRVDRLQESIQNWTMDAESQNLERKDIFKGIWRLTHQFEDLQTPDIDLVSAAVPQMSEPWYCCAEPTQNQRRRVAGGYAGSKEQIREALPLI